MSENANKKHMKTQSRSEQKRDQKAFGNASKKLSETRARSFENYEKEAFINARKKLTKAYNNARKSREIKQDKSWQKHRGCE